MTFDIEDQHLPAFVACLAIGTLHAIRQTALPTTAGIWSLGAPKFWQRLAGRSRLLDEISAVLRECDELSAIERAIPDQLTEEIDKLIARLERLLKGQPGWA